MSFAAVVVLGYLLGSCPWGYWLVRVVKHEDIRTVGSGNIGATNVWRTYGKSLGIPVAVRSARHASTEPKSRFTIVPKTPAGSPP